MSSSDNESDTQHDSEDYPSSEDECHSEYYARRIMLTVVTRTVNHCGYCSGAENKPTIDVELQSVIIPDSLPRLKIGHVLKRSNYCLFDIHLKKTNLQGDSMYCDCSWYWDDIRKHESISEIVCAIAI